MFKSKYNFDDSLYYINDFIKLYPNWYNIDNNFFKKAVDNIHKGIITAINITDNGIVYTLDSDNNYFENELYTSIKDAYNAYLIILEKTNKNIAEKYSFEKFENYCKKHNITYKKEKNKRKYSSIIKNKFNLFDSPYYIYEYPHIKSANNFVDFAFTLFRSIHKCKITEIKCKNDGSISYNISGCIRNENEIFIDKKDAFNFIFSFLEKDMNYHNNKEIIANINFFKAFIN